MDLQEKPLAEITVKAVVLGVLLSVVLAAANAYLGLFAGMTVSASIPAAVVSMGVLRLFRKSNILENNIRIICIKTRYSCYFSTTREVSGRSYLHTNFQWI